MVRKKRILCILGTRPECIKMAPVILALRAADVASVTVLSTGQHREMTRQILTGFGIEIDCDLDVMLPNQSLGRLSSHLFRELDAFLEAAPHDMMLVQGDTTSVMAAGLVAFYRDIPVGHVEAGLRTFDLRSPFPEELNRVITTMVSTLHFAPTQSARANLLREGVSKAMIYVTGNTVIDALLMTASRFTNCPYPTKAGRRLVLVTAHRRENFGAPLRHICEAIARLARTFTDVEFVYPVHPNPNVSGPVRECLAGLTRVYLVPPMDYTALVPVMQRSHFIMTDSGGLQEEAPALGKPVLVLRAETERPEAVQAGAARVIGTDPEQIVASASELLTDEDAYRRMATVISPYGDGRAAARIAEVCRKFLSAAQQPPEPVLICAPV